MATAEAGDVSMDLSPPALTEAAASRHPDPMALGATMYVPALHPAAAEVVAGTRHPGLRSMVLCLEDAIREDDVGRGLDRLAAILRAPMPASAPLTFVRPRDIGMAARIGAMTGACALAGFVVPKLELEGVAAWFRLSAGTGLPLMPTLERPWVFDPTALSAFAAALRRQDRERIVAIRVGGNDLLATMGLRRAAGATAYEGPLLWGLSQIICQLGAQGWPLTAPVWDVLDDHVTLAREAAADVAFGFVGKTAVHPDQIAPIHRALAVTAGDLALARRTLNADAPAVFRAGGVMSEPATHRAWAGRIVARARHWGVAGQ
jgi:citrate lyase beta subunit